MQQLRTTPESISEVEAKQWFMNICKSVIPNFIVDQDNKEVLNKLFQYTFRMPEFETNSLSLNKGILLLGPYGTGKTELFKIMQRALATLKSPINFQIRVMWQIASQYTKEGFDATEIAKGHCFFDEMGLDGREMVQNYGNKVNISDVVILQRYNDFKSFQYLSHFTSNKTLKELKEYLDGRSFDRLLEMCNVIPLTGESRRKSAVPIPVIKPTESKMQDKEQTINMLQFLQKHIKDGKTIDVLPITEVYRLMVSQGHLKQPNSKIFEDMYQGKKTEAYHEYQLMIEKTVFPEKQSWIKKQEELSKSDSIDITRRVYKQLILEAIR